MGKATAQRTLADTLPEGRIDRPLVWIQTGLNQQCILERNRISHLKRLD